MIYLHWYVLFLLKIIMYIYVFAGMSVHFRIIPCNICDPNISLTFSCTCVKLYINLLCEKLRSTISKFTYNRLK